MRAHYVDRSIARGFPYNDMIVGVTSSGYCAAQSGVVYTDVMYFRRWIYDIMNYNEESHVDLTDLPTS